VHHRIIPWHRVLVKLIDLQARLFARMGKYILNLNYVDNRNQNSR
jgi:hypothetical protein